MEDKFQSTSLYVPRRVVQRLEDCYFYHSMDLPGHGYVAGEWDLRLGVERYLGHVDFHGKRVLDVGTASGFLAFWMERQGAEVVALNVSENNHVDIVPFGGDVDPVESSKVVEHIHKLNNSFWFTHALLGSKVRMVYGTVYEVPEGIGQVDVAIFGSILLHLRDPFLALQKAAKLTRETIVVTEPFSNYKYLLALLSTVKPMAVFMPNARKSGPLRQWWSLPPRAVVEFLRVLGFPHIRVTYHIQRYHGKRQLMYTVVGRRTAPIRT